jgi:serine/threonine protein kinase
MRGKFHVPTASEFSWLRCLGKGTYSEVWLARKHSNLQYFAVKILDSRRSKFNLERVQRERDILEKVRSPHIVKMYYAWEEAGYFFIALEYHPRGTLTHFLRRLNNLPEVEEDGTEAVLPPTPAALVSAVVVDLATAVETLHEAGICHRDIKPDNLLLDGNGHIVLSDFGLAMLSQPESLFHIVCGTSQDLRSSAVGSPLYRAPETFCEVMRRPNLPAYSSRKIDIWSMGVLIHELLTGTYALNPPTPDGKSCIDIESVQHLTTEMLSYVRGERGLYWPTNVAVAEDARDLVQRMLHPVPGKRPSIHEVLLHPFIARHQESNATVLRVGFPARKSSGESSAAAADRRPLPFDLKRRVRRSYDAENFSYVAGTDLHEINLAAHTRLTSVLGWRYRSHGDMSVLSGRRHDRDGADVA